MTLTMLSACSPYQSLKQILSQIEHKRRALSEAFFSMQKKNVDVEEFEEQLKGTLKPVEQKRLEVLIAEAKALSSFNMIYIEACLKEIGSYQKAYQEICESHNIPETWNEEDAEKAEVRHHLKTAFRLGIRDIVGTGRLNHATMEYMEQFGVNPITALPLITNYCDKAMSDGNATFENLMEFLDGCADRFAESHKEVMKRLGLKTLIDADWLFKG
jgi:hypothetical protein